MQKLPISPNGNAEIVINQKTGEVRQAGSDRAAEFIATFRRNAEQSLFLFARGVLGYTALTRTLHRPFCQLLQKPTPKRKLILMPRGHYKTTCAKALVIHATIQPDGQNVYFPEKMGQLTHTEGTSTRILLGSKAAKLAKGSLAEVTLIYEQNELLRALWPHCIWQNPKRQAKWWNQDMIELPRREVFKEPTIMATGVDSAVVGFHFNLHMFDDLIDNESADSPAVMASAIAWFKNTRPLMDGQDISLEITTGTRWAVGDLYEDIITNDPTVEVYHRRAIEDGKPILPEAFTMEQFERMQQPSELGPAMFALLMMNDATDPELVDFDLAMLRSCRVVDDGKYIEYDEGEMDMVLQENFSAARENLALLGAGPPPPKRGTQYQSDVTAESLREDFFRDREQFVPTRRVRSS